MQLIHEAGGQVYMDGANMNAQVGHTNRYVGADVCHLNLHKTFAYLMVAAWCWSYLCCRAPCTVSSGSSSFNGTDKNTVSAAAYGSAGVLEITYAYIRMMGAEGLKQATEIAILSANYLVENLKTLLGFYIGVRKVEWGTSSF